MSAERRSESSKPGSITCRLTRRRRADGGKFNPLTKTTLTSAARRYPSGTAVTKAPVGAAI